MTAVTQVGDGFDHVPVPNRAWAPSTLSMRPATGPGKPRIGGKTCFTWCDQAATYRLGMAPGATGHDES